MAISEGNKKFIDSLLEHYTIEAESYRQIAENFTPTVKSVEDTAFGIIAGCVYSGFLQAYQSQQESPGLDDLKEFYDILNKKAPTIKKAILGQDKPSKKPGFSPDSQTTVKDMDKDDDKRMDMGKDKDMGKDVSKGMDTTKTDKSMPNIQK
ncbi:MAG: hypothetical protein OXC46_08780 [Thaumarchaeota archaeon]|nr:hypothetical protein [Nitrososphaerota archaeon]